MYCSLTTAVILQTIVVIVFVIGTQLLILSCFTTSLLLLLLLLTISLMTSSCSSHDKKKCVIIKNKNNNNNNNNPLYRNVKFVENIFIPRSLSGGDRCSQFLFWLCNVCEFKTVESRGAGLVFFALLFHIILLLLL